MADIDIDDWKAPKWHADFGDSEQELRLLREFCWALRKKYAEYDVQLDCFEEGYMNVNIGAGVLGKIAELHIVTSDDYIYGLFIEDSGEEIYFNKIEDGLRFFDECNLTG